MRRVAVVRRPRELGDDVPVADDREGVDVRDAVERASPGGRSRRTARPGLRGASAEAGRSSSSCLRVPVAVGIPPAAAVVRTCRRRARRASPRASTRPIAPESVGQRRRRPGTSPAARGPRRRRARWPGHRRARRCRGRSRHRMPRPAATRRARVRPTRPSSPSPRPRPRSGRARTGGARTQLRREVDRARPGSASRASIGDGVPAASRNRSNRSASPRAARPELAGDRHDVARRARRCAAPASRPSSEPSAVTAIVSVSETVRSPPSTAQPGASASHAARRPSAMPSTNDSRVSSGIARATSSAVGRAPIAAMSARLTAAAFQPRSKRARPREAEVGAVHERVDGRDDAAVRGREHRRVVARSDERRRCAEPVEDPPQDRALAAARPRSGRGRARSLPQASRRDRPARRG